MPPPSFPVNTHRHDPYQNFRFLVRWDGQVVAGVTRVSPLVRTTEVIVVRDGREPGSSRKSPGRTEFAPVTLERGVTHDPEFERWALLAFNRQGDAAMSLKHFRKDIVLDLLNEQGRVALSWRIYRCWVSTYVAVPELDANRAAIAFESITLQNEGWERDTEVPEPVET